MTELRSSIDAIARTFDLGTEVQAVTFAARGAMGSIFYVRTEKGEWAVKELFDWWDDTGIEDQTAFVEAARAHGVPAPAARRSMSGRIIDVVDGVGVRVYEWTPNDGSPERPITDAFANEAGRILAHLHETSMPRDDEPDVWYLSRSRGLPWPAFADEFRADALGDRLSMRMVELEALDRLATHRPDGPWQACHRDYQPMNTLIDASGHLVVVDWENAGPLDPVSEIGYSVVTWASEPDGDPIDETVRLFFEGYASVRELPAPRGVDAFSVLACVWLNFLAVQFEVLLDANLPRSEHQRSREIADGMLTALPTIERLQRYLDIWASIASGRP